jgi:hypothetical protein
VRHRGYQWGILMRRWIVALLASLALAISLTSAAWADAGPSGQTNYAQQSVEPAFDDMTGNLIYLKTPINAPFPSQSNPRAAAPMYLPMYPTGSSVDPLNCLPTNCDHVQVLPAGLVAALHLTSVYPTGTISTKYGMLTGGLVKGHDHLVGVAKTGGDFNIAWHVYLLLFTPHAVADGAINTHLTTLAAIDQAIAAGDVAGPIDSGIVFNCSIVPAGVYNHGS